MKRLLAAALLALPLAGHSQSSSVPNLISYQSRVADASGTPIGAPTPVNRIVLFRIYDSAGGSARLYSEQQTVTIANGEFSVLLGSGTQIATDTGNTFSSFNAAVFGGATRFLGVTVDDGDGNPFNDPEMSPRQQIATTPFAFRSAVAESVALGGVGALSLANNSVGTAAIASAAITNEKLATNAVGTTQVADAAVTTVKIASDAIDSSKIADGSIALNDLSTALQASMPKPSFTYNQGLAANPGSHIFTIFPIDVSDLGVDGEVLVSYYGGNRAGILSGRIPAVFSGQVRVNMLTFTTGNGSMRYEGGFFSILSSSAGGALVAETAASSFVAKNEGPFPESNYAVTGNMNSTSMGTALIADPASSAVFFQSTAMFPRSITTLSGQGTTASPYSNASGGNFFGGTSTPLAMVAARWMGDGSFAGAAGITYTMPLIIITHYYPGSLLPVQVAAPFNADQANVSTNANAGGPTQTHTISSIATGTNKLTVTVPNPHVMQVGDTVVLASTTGVPAANGTFTITAVPDRTRFEITLTGATGTYTGGTATHTPRYNKYRLWVAVNTSAAGVRVIVSDK